MTNAARTSPPLRWRRRRIVRYAPLPTLTKGCLPACLVPARLLLLHGVIGVAWLDPGRRERVAWHSACHIHG